MATTSSREGPGSSGEGFLYGKPNPKKREEILKAQEEAKGYKRKEEREEGADYRHGNFTTSDSPQLPIKNFTKQTLRTRLFILLNSQAGESGGHSWVYVDEDMRISRHPEDQLINQMVNEINKSGIQVTTGFAVAASTQGVFVDHDRAFDIPNWYVATVAKINERFPHLMSTLNHYAGTKGQIEINEMIMQGEADLAIKVLKELVDEAVTGPVGTDPNLEIAVQQHRENEAQTLVDQLAKQEQNQELGKPVAGVEELKEQLETVNPQIVGTDATKLGMITEDQKNVVEQQVKEVYGTSKESTPEQTIEEGSSPEPSDLESNIPSISSIDEPSGHESDIISSITSEEQQGSSPPSEPGSQETITSSSLPPNQTIGVPGGQGVAYTGYTPKYHRSAIAVFFNSADTPQWDPELEGNIRNAGYSRDEALEVMKGIVYVEGHNILVPKVKTDGEIDELVEILELHFSFNRNMSRGPRIPIVGIPLSQLLGVGGATTPPVSGEYAGTESASQVGGEASPMGTKISTNVVSTPKPPVQVDLADAWNNRKYAMGGFGAKGPRVDINNAAIQSVAKIKIVPTYGPGLQIPVNNSILSIKSRARDCMPILKVRNQQSS